MAKQSKEQDQQAKGQRDQDKAQSRQAKGQHKQESGGEKRKQSRQQGGKLNLNQASREDLMQIEGIGPTLADIIIKYRDEHGGFKAIDELDEVPGLAEVRVDKVKERVSV